MSSKKVTSFFVVILWLLLVALSVGAIVYFYKKTNGFTEDLPGFEVRFNGSALSEGSQLDLERDIPYSFEIKYPLGLSGDYLVKIVANEEADFSFTVDEQWLAWRTMGDITAAFGLEEQENAFTLKIPAGCSAERVIRSLYEGREVSAPSDEELPTPYIYTLVVSSADSGTEYHFPFAVKWTDGMDIQAPDHIYF